MTEARLNVLVVGATGSVGKLVVAEAIEQGHTVRALIRKQARARDLPSGVQVVVGDLTQQETLAPALADIDAIVFTHGADGGGKQGSEAVDYGGVRNILSALGSKKPRMALMTAVGVTNRESSYTGPRKLMMGSVARKGSCAPEATPTPLFDRAGSTTTRPTSTSSCFCKETRGRPGTQVMASSHVTSLRRCLSEASRRLTQFGKPLNWSQHPAQLRKTSIPCLLSWSPIRRTPSMESRTARTSRWRKNQRVFWPICEVS